MVFFCWALRLTAAAHVALYIGASPIWALLVEERPGKNWSSLRRYGAALLAVSGVVVLLWPALHADVFNLKGELCGLLSSLLWANFNHQSRVLARNLSGLEVAANAMWMSGVWLLPAGLITVATHGLGWDGAALGGAGLLYSAGRGRALRLLEFRVAALADQPRDVVQ